MLQHKAPFQRLNCRRAVLALFCVFSLCLFAGCGYQWGQGGTISSYRTISIPYVKGDWDGDLTAALIQAVSESGSLSYRSKGGALILKVEIIDERHEDVGFRYDRKKNGHIRDSVIPDETRAIMYVDVTLLEAFSGCVVLGPARLSAEMEFDHYYYSNQGRVNIFSLGQFTDYDDARDAAQRPLNRRLALKIVDYINSNW
jgi:hypothetical protein